MRIGKLAVVEPIFSFEIIIAALLAYFVLSEAVDIFTLVLIFSIIFGLFLVSFQKEYFKKQYLMEKGTILAFASAVLMGAANFFMGWGARETNPLLANFFVCFFIAFCCALFLIFKGRVVKTISDIYANRRILFMMSVSDNIAWIAFAFAASIIPVAVATALSESYIIIAVALGIFVNREKLQFHQKFGLADASVAAVILAALVG